VSKNPICFRSRSVQELEPLQIVQVAEPVSHSGDTQNRPTDLTQDIDGEVLRGTIRVHRTAEMSPKQPKLIYN
jgi:hypothetical protein